MAIPPETHVGPVRLTVVDLDREREFYERAIGLRVLDDDKATTTARRSASGPTARSWSS